MKSSMDVQYEMKNNEDRTEKIHDLFGEALRLRGQYGAEVNAYVHYQFIGLRIETTDRDVLKSAVSDLVEKKGVPDFIRNGSDWKLAEDILSTKGYKLTRFAHFLGGSADGKHAIRKKVLS